MSERLNRFLSSHEVVFMVEIDEIKLFMKMNFSIKDKHNEEHFT